MSIYTTVALPKLLKQICAMEMKGKTCTKIKECTNKLFFKNSKRKVP